MLGPSYWWFPKDMVPSFPEAMCVGKPPQWWDRESDPELHLLGRKVCRACPVMLECRTWAAEKRESGLWGGWLFSAGRRVKMWEWETNGR